jgi:hypothetical protein
MHRGELRRHSRDLRAFPAASESPRRLCLPLSSILDLEPRSELAIAKALASRMPGLAAFPSCLRLSSLLLPLGGGPTGSAPTLPGLAMASVSTSSNGVAQEPVSAPSQAPSPPKVCRLLFFSLSFPAIGSSSVLVVYLPFGMWSIFLFFC